MPSVNTKKCIGKMKMQVNKVVKTLTFPFWDFPTKQACWSDFRLFLLRILKKITTVTKTWIYIFEQFIKICSKSYDHYTIQGS